MSTKKDLTELLSYAVKKAAVVTEVKVAWAGLSPLEKVLAKRAGMNGRAVPLTTIKKLAALIEEKPAVEEAKPAKRDFASYRFKKKTDMSKKACSAGCKCSKCCGKKKMKKSAACNKMIEMLKKANFVKSAATTVGAPPAGAADSIWNETSPLKFISGAWGKARGWQKALAIMAGAGLLGHSIYGAGREWSKRYDPGVDPSAKGIGLDRDLANALREQMAKAQASSAELGALQRGWRNAYAPLYGL
jgi:hypothetical protein